MDNKILNKDYIFLDVDLKTQKDAFKFIADKAFEMKLVTDKEKLIKGYEKRESEGSTGFEDGFAIPHARIKEVKQAAVFVLRFKNGIDWDSMDGQPTKVAIALLVPDGPNGDEHLSMLSDIAVKLMDEDFKKTLKTTKSIDKVLESLDSTKKESTEQTAVENKNGLNILAITACVTGVAHTYMAEEKLLKEVPKMGNNIKVETHGSKGVGTPFTQKDIDNADLVIFAVDVNVDKSRFAGKKFYQVKVAKAIKDPQGVVKEAIEKGTVLSKEVGSFDTKAKQEKSGVLQHIMAGISYMIPVIILGGICLAFSLGIAKAIWGPSSGTAGPDGTDTWNILNVMQIVGGAAFALMIPILGGFIANSIAGRSAIAPAMVASFIGNQAGAMDGNGNVTSLGDLMPWIKGMDVVQTPMGFIGAIIAGLCVGYFVKWVNTWNVPKALRAAMPIFFVPIVAGLGMSLIFIYVIGAPIGWVMQKVQDGIKSAYSGNIGIGVGIGLGIILGAMAGFDMGGPINKIAFITCSMLVTQEIYEPMGAMAAGIPVAPIAMGLSTIIVPKFFTKDERGLGIAAMIMGCIGISEGAIPFAIRDPKRAVVANVIGSAVAAGIAGGLGCQDYAAHGGPIVAILGAVPYGLQTLYFFISIAIGVLVTTAIYVSWLKFDAGQPGSVKEAHVQNLMNLSSDKKEKLSDIKEEIETTKEAKKQAIKEASIEGKDKNSLTLEFDQKIQSLEKQKEQIISEYKQSVLKAKNTYKELSPEEKEFVKTKKVEIEKSNKQINNSTKTEIEEINSQLLKAKSESNKALKRQTIDSLREEKVEIRAKGFEQRNEISAKYRQTFVDKYKQLVNA